MWNTKLLVSTSIILSVFLFTSIPDHAQGAKILTVGFISSKSHKITYERLLEELGARGHEVTVLSPIVSHKKVKNVKQILTMDAEKMTEEQGKEMPNFFEMKEKGEEMNPFKMLDMFGKYCKITYDLPHVQALLKEKFDLVIVSAIFNECAAGFVYKLNTTIIMVSPAGVSSWLTHFTGGSSPPSFVPNLFTPYSDRMTFYQRMMNFVTEVMGSVVYNFYYSPYMAELYRNKLNDPNIPLPFDVFKNTSLMLSNGHFALNSPKPFLPDIIEVAGMHCVPAQKLPADLENFINGAGEHGFIYFSMGSAIRGSTLPEKKRKMFLAAFSKMKQRVLWKWETETMDDLPPNVKLSKWLPQQDILGHPKLRVFITHGGFGSITESVYHGAPLIGIPMFGDQGLNVQVAKEKGFAYPLDFNALTEDVLVSAMNTVITDPKYKDSVRALSQIFRDQPQAALDRAVFWTEYIIRHKGAVHLRSAARDLNFMQYYSLDVISFLLAIVFITFYIVAKIICFIWTKLCGGKKQSSGTTKSKKKN